MFHGLTSRLSYSNVAATLAIFLALGGGYALATVSGDGSVTFGAEKGLSTKGIDTVLNMPGIGKLQAACSKGTIIRFKNTSGGALQATVLRASDTGAVADFDSDTLADGESLEDFSGLVDPDTLRFHVFKASASGTPAADITVGSRYGDGPCDSRTVTAQAISHG